MKKRLLAGILFAVALAAAGILWQVSKPEAQAGGKAVTVEVLSSRDGYEKSFAYETDEDYLGDLLVEEGLVSAQDSDYGRFITAVKDMKADDSQQYWWSIAVDGAMAETGMDDLPLTDGSTYTLELKQGY